MELANDIYVTKVNTPLSVPPFCQSVRSTRHSDMYSSDAPGPEYLKANNGQYTLHVTLALVRPGKLFRPKHPREKFG